MLLGLWASSGWSCLNGLFIRRTESESGALLQNEHSDTLDHKIRAKRLPVPLSEDTYKPTHQKAVWDHEWSHKSLRPIIFFRKGHRLFPVSILSYTMALNGLSGPTPSPSLSRSGFGSLLMLAVLFCSWSKGRVLWFFLLSPLCLELSQTLMP